jgi:hypothetical protein
MHPDVLPPLAAASCVAAESIPAAQVKWKGHFGESRIDTNTLFCLMAQGGFRAETTNVEKLVTTWLKAHSKAVVMTVLSHRPLVTARPSSRFAYVWVVQGSDNLNVELVRQGCFAAGTQSPMQDDKIEVPGEDYRAFVAQIAEAAEEAKREKRGIWQHAPK